VERELDRLRSLQHPHIVTIYEAKLERSVSDHQSWILHILMEYEQGGSLYDLLQKCGGGLRLTVARKYMKQLLWAINHLHLNGFVCKGKHPKRHFPFSFFLLLGITPSNVFCTKNQTVKLADISYAKRLQGSRRKTTL
jgi:translation initiation factor 2-alpha kinase 4